MKRISLKEAVNFHGHLGPYLVVGLLAGEAVLKILACRKYFGLKVLVYVLMSLLFLLQSLLFVIVF